ncbi:hypothetical protein D9756_005682 [Leucocoprinus leucothites]|uniref:Rit1 N-terminal domain-containing protein n=1 Tax=Leucocoprinus leucothites TaxID=201217 RepID=A0A8H5FZF2_9AGAR|nr:hypothetical protein D9756_005682 [Leucoagaricus leucothites]
MPGNLFHSLLGRHPDTEVLEGAAQINQHCRQKSTDLVIRHLDHVFNDLHVNFEALNRSSRNSHQVRNQRHSIRRLADVSNQSLDPEHRNQTSRLGSASYPESSGPQDGPGQDGMEIHASEHMADGQRNEWQEPFELQEANESFLSQAQQLDPESSMSRSRAVQDWTVKYEPESPEREPERRARGKYRSGKDRERQAQTQQTGMGRPDKLQVPSYSNPLSRPRVSKPLPEIPIPKIVQTPPSPTGAILDAPLGQAEPDGIIQGFRHGGPQRSEAEPVHCSATRFRMEDLVESQDISDGTLSIHSTSVGEHDRETSDENLRSLIRHIRSLIKLCQEEVDKKAPYSQEVPNLSSALGLLDFIMELHEASEIPLVDYRELKSLRNRSGRLCTRLTKERTTYETQKLFKEVTPIVMRWAQIMNTRRRWDFGTSLPSSSVGKKVYGESLPPVSTPSHAAASQQGSGDSPQDNLQASSYITALSHLSTDRHATPPALPSSGPDFDCSMERRRNRSSLASSTSYLSYANGIASETPAYFKSTDGHMGNRGFNLRRENLHLLPLISQKSGIVLVDSTRRENSTVRFVFGGNDASWNLLHRQSGISSCTRPEGVVSAQEHHHITIKLDGWAKALADSSFELPLDLLAPLRPFWITPSITTFPVLDANTQSPAFFPIICISASKQVETGTERRFGGFAYVQGSGDDHKLWGMGLAPQIFWQYRAELIASPRASLEDLIRRNVSSSPTSYTPSPTDVNFLQSRFSPTPVHKTNRRIKLASFPPTDLDDLLSSLRSGVPEGVNAAYIILNFSLSPNNLEASPLESGGLKKYPLPQNMLHTLALLKGKTKPDTHFLQHILPTTIPFIKNHLLSNLPKNMYILEGRENDSGTRLDVSVDLGVVISSPGLIFCNA